MKPKLKVMHLIGSVSVGGAQRLVLDLAAKTNKDEFEVHICTFGPVKEKNFLPDFVALDLPMLRIPSKDFYDPRVLWKIRNYILKNNIDIIHTHLTDGDIVGSFAGWFTRRPVITTIHNEPKRFKELRIDRRTLNYFSAKYLTTHLVAVSGFLRERFIEEWKIPEMKISTVYNAVDLTALLKAPLERSHKPDAAKYTITTVGRLTKQKAQHILIEAAPKVLDEFPDTKFLLVGEGKLEQELRQLVHTLGVEKSVDFTGLRRDVADILAKSDIFLLSSLWEGLPLSAIEAMASGCAVVLTDVGGNRELIEHKKNGMIVPAGDIDALAVALIAVLENEEFRLSLGREARAKAVEKFSIEALAQEYEALYIKVKTKFR